MALTIFSEITPLPERASGTKPDADGELWNTRYTEVNLNFELLEGGSAGEFWQAGGGWAVPAGSGITNGHVIQDEGTPLTQRGNLDFIGGGVTAADGASATEVTIPSSAEEIAAASEKTTPVDADKIGLFDSAAAGVLKWLSWANLKTALDYVALTGAQTIAGIKTFSSFPVTPSSAPSADYEVANKKYVDDNAGGGASSNGWNPISATLTYSSADDPTYVISSDTDLSDVLSVGMKLWFQNGGGDVYGFITALGAWSGSAQLITMYGGTDYDVANSAITAPYYSTGKSPLGFPLDDDIWSVIVTVNTDNSTASPTTTYDNTGYPSIDIPIGAWNLSYSAVLYGSYSVGGLLTVYVTLSTTTNSETDNEFTGFIQFGSLTNISASVYKTKHLELAAKDTYYINLRRGASSPLDTIGLFGAAVSPTNIIAKCAYL